MSITLNADRITKARVGPWALAGFLAAFFDRRRERLAYRRNCRELRELPDHILRDIGVSRGDIPALVAELRRTGRGRPDPSWKI